MIGWNPYPSESYGLILKIGSLIVPSVLKKLARIRIELRGKVRFFKRQRDRQTRRWTGNRRQPVRRPDRQTDEQTYRQTQKWLTDRQTMGASQPARHRQIDRRRNRETHRQIGRHIDKE